MVLVDFFSDRQTSDVGCCRNTMGDRQWCIALLEKLHHLHTCGGQNATERWYVLLQNAAAG